MIDAFIRGALIGLGVYLVTKIGAWEKSKDRPATKRDVYRYAEANAKRYRAEAQRIEASGVLDADESKRAYNLRTAAERLMIEANDCLKLRGKAKISEKQMVCKAIITEADQIYTTGTESGCAT